jgi:HlyD family secretion protein
LKKPLLILITAAVLIPVIYWAMSDRSVSENELTYITVPLEKGSLRAEINSSGTLRPLVEVLVGAQVTGTIKQLEADFESQVTKDQLIALIDPDKFEAKVGQSRADLESAKASLVKAEVTLVDELRTLQRKESLIEKNSISQSEYDTAKTKADAAVAQVAVEKAKVAQMDAKLKESELELKYTRILAPVSGTVTARTGDVGQTVTAGFQTPVLFKIAEDLTRMQVHTNVDEADIGRVKVCQKAFFTVPAFPEDVFEALVSQIRNDPKVEQNVVTYNVILDVRNDDQKLRPGMTANVQILIDEVRDALMAPEQALRFSPGENGRLSSTNRQQRIMSKRGKVWKLEGKDKLLPVDVGVGVIGAEKVQLLSDQLKEGDKIVVAENAKKKKDSQATPALRFKF